MTERIPIFATIIHSCDQISRSEIERITVHYGGVGYVEAWNPGKPITMGAVHFTQAAPATDRNGIEQWQGKNVRMISYTTATIETKGT